MELAGKIEQAEEEVAELRRNVVKLESDAINEAAGVGPTKKRGKGSIYEAIKQQAEELRRRLPAAENELSKLKNEKDAASQQLARLNGVIAVKISENSEVIKEQQRVDQEKLNLWIKMAFSISTSA